jgi:hypothetical protein
MLREILDGVEKLKKNLQEIYESLKKFNDENVDEAASEIIRAPKTLKSKFKRQFSQTLTGFH